eukprot:gene6661-77_t
MPRSRGEPRLKQKWITPAVLAAMRRRDQLHKQLDGTPERIERFTNVRRVAQAMERVENQAHGKTAMGILSPGKRRKEEPDCTPQRMLRVLQDKLRRVRTELERFPAAPLPKATHHTELREFAT